jgi:hypothetical protein
MTSRSEQLDQQFEAYMKRFQNRTQSGQRDRQEPSPVRKQTRGVSQLPERPERVDPPREPAIKYQKDFKETKTLEERLRDLRGETPFKENKAVTE